MWKEMMTEKNRRGEWSVDEGRKEEEGEGPDPRTSLMTQERLKVTTSG